MNSINLSNDTKQINPEKLLGKKIKRFKNIIKPINKKQTINPPKISKSTLLQIEKVNKNKKFKFEHSTNISIYKEKESSKYKLPELSLKEQYQDLIERKELILPPKYRILLKKQNYLDDILSSSNQNNAINNNIDNNNTNKESKFHSYKEIQNYFVKKINLNFSDKDFQQILYICPFYYIYQSINKIMKGIEIKYIDIPKDYIQRMNKKYNLRTNFTLMQTPKIYETMCGEINKAVMEKRKKLFKKLLINITLEQHQKFLKENNIEIFDPIKARTWHHNFDLKNVADIGIYNLVENNIKEYKKLIII
jgi:hypothetical protein